MDWTDVPALLWYRIWRPWWTWRPSRVWCSWCWRWGEPHRHVNFAFNTERFEAGLRQASEALELMTRAVKAADEYEASLRKVAQAVTAPTLPAVMMLAALGLSEDDKDAA